MVGIVPQVAIAQSCARDRDRGAKRGFFPWSMPPPRVGRIHLWGSLRLGGRRSARSAFDGFPAGDTALTRSGVQLVGRARQIHEIISRRVVVVESFSTHGLSLRPC